MAKLNIAVIFGGPNNEHEISLKTAKQVISSLDVNKYDILPIAITKNWQWLVGSDAQTYLDKAIAGFDSAGLSGVDLNQIIAEINPQTTGLADLMSGRLASQKIDLALPLGHGFFMEDGRLQAILEALGIKYAMSDVLASAFAMSKTKSKLIAKSVGLKIAKDLVITSDKKYDVAKIAKRLVLPVMVKPTESGSSVGVSLCKTEEELKAGIANAFNFGKEVMVEQYIKGRELSVAVVEGAKGRVLPVIEIVPKLAEWFNFDSKYKDGGADEICPADLIPEVSHKAQRLALKLFKSMGCRDLARVDFIYVERENKFYFIEINTIPGLTANSLVPKAAKAYGLEFGEFLDRIIKTRLKNNI